MDKIVQYFIVLVILFSVTSCIKDEPSECPSEYTVKIYIKDKNYANIAQIIQLQPIDDSLPLSSYISNLYYSLRNISTGDIYMESPLINLSGTSQYYTIDYKNVPRGKYELVVWGNPESKAESENMHANNSESTDLFTVSAELDFTTSPQEKILELERVKGKLLVISSNFPSGITSIEQNINNVYSSVNPKKDYSGNTTVKKSFSAGTILETFIAPTVAPFKSVLKLIFKTDSSPVGDLIIPDIELILKRNEISLVSINYNDIADEWEISTFIDNQWTIIHHFNINEL